MKIIGGYINGHRVYLGYVNGYEIIFVPPASMELIDNISLIPSQEIHLNPSTIFNLLSETTTGVTSNPYHLSSETTTLGASCHEEERVGETPEIIVGLRSFDGEFSSVEDLETHWREDIPRNGDFALVNVGGGKQAIYEYVSVDRIFSEAVGLFNSYEDMIAQTHQSKYGNIAIVWEWDYELGKNIACLYKRDADGNWILVRKFDSATVTGIILNRGTLIESNFEDEQQEAWEDGATAELIFSFNREDFIEEEGEHSIQRIICYILSFPSETYLWSEGRTIPNGLTRVFPADIPWGHYEYYNSIDASLSVVNEILAEILGSVSVKESSATTCDFELFDSFINVPLESEESVTESDLSITSSLFSLPPLEPSETTNISERNTISIIADSITKFTLELTEEGLEQTIYLTQSESNGIYIDWGETFIPVRDEDEIVWEERENITPQRAKITHVYPSPGEYVVRIFAKPGVTWCPGYVISEEYVLTPEEKEEAEEGGETAVFYGTTYYKIADEFFEAEKLHNGLMFQEDGSQIDLADATDVGYVEDYIPNVPAPFIVYSESMFESEEYDFLLIDLEEPMVDENVNIPSAGVWVTAEVRRLYFDNTYGFFGKYDGGTKGGGGGSYPYLTSFRFGEGATLEVQGAFADCNYLKEIFLPSSINRIPAGTFAGSGIETAYLSDSITDIGAVAFSGSSLTSIRFSSELLSIGNNAFLTCPLTELILPDKLVSIGDGAFLYCSDIVSIQWGKSIREIGVNAFVTSTSADVSVNIRDLSSWCKTDFSNALLLSTSGMGKLFVNGEPLRDLIIPSDVTDIGAYAFYGADNLRSVTLHNGVKSIGRACFSLSGLSSVTLNEGLETIGSSAFHGAKITNIYIPSTVSDIGSGAFSSYSTIITSATLKEINVSPYNQYYTSNQGVLFTKDYKELIQYPAGNTRTNYTISSSTVTIGKGAFEENRYLTSVVLPSGLKTIGDSAFSYCSSLTSLSIPNTVTEIGQYAFQYCSRIKTINIPSGLTTIKYYSFAQLGITSITIPSAVTTIESSAFSSCSSLSSLTLPSTIENVASNAFQWCDKLARVEIGAKSLANRVFSGCDMLTRVWIRNTCTTIQASSASNSPFSGGSDSLIIYAESSSKPSGWSNFFNRTGRRGSVTATTYYGRTTRPW